MRSKVVLSLASLTGVCALFAAQPAMADDVVVVPNQQQQQPPPPPEQHTTTIVQPAPAPQPAPQPQTTVTAVQQPQPVVAAPPPAAETVETTNPPISRSGAQAEANIGTAFNSTYNVGFGARVGFTTDMGIYIGGDVEHFIGRGRSDGNTPHMTFLGGELGYKFFPTADNRLEIRPYGFLGGAIDSSGNSDVAFHPGLLAAYRFGGAFVSLDGRLLATPAPTSMAMMFGAGVNF